MNFINDLSNLWSARGEIGSAFVDAGQQLVQQGAQEWSDLKEGVKEKALAVVEDAKASIREPLFNTLSSVAQIARKAVPTALASAATMQYTGGKPTFAAFLQPVSLRSRFLWAGFDRHERIGYPLEDFRYLSSQSGFIQCENVRLDLAATATTPGATLEEQQLIKQYLEAGCYIE